MGLKSNQPWFIVGGLVVVGLYLLALAAGAIITYRTERRPDNQRYLDGTYPTSELDGPYNAIQPAGGNWLGKRIDGANHSGINRFKNGERYVFKLEPVKDGSRQVMRLNYNQPGNPWWLHRVIDEMVQVGEQHYLGKVFVKFPFLPRVTVAFFELKAE